MNTILTFLKSRKFLVGVAVVVVAFLVLGFVYPVYSDWKGRKGVENLANALKQMQEDDYKAAMADTYGGKTPQETLQMYIDAVEKGDYELASKYFIGGKQEEWKNNLKEIMQSNKESLFLDPLKKSINSIGYFSSDQLLYTIEKPVFIEFRKYPNGIWKILEI
ncbi:MAG: hypothetical protein A2V96_01605 [Candidatus Yonathbacteria bacterium RBG_16_43_6]|uniref:DUF4878 domain-containing protein n=1 Tax=Candidatus Yonathbacteria bacterium RIFCSPLOWO2_01_FULL_43_27 TaxID=1802726 RepID=A0A1G2SCF1_9BACT|nr:MAG: hypothetical protein A2658_01760 [Candidatus Yonathbacteria bacterium RIFCSPHIGHO2_01_FULL_44_19]OHA80220.1 MAG: hypothetical protein A2V96_01605 [Candidatus Yonathbacteria bacterium RBG_16_43_6]OHA82675.1 MAG: hypothetical protein A3B07_01965 [Candidatus Yonathbacteria bacterium RIFCSPLOWO2_01_FULL_43_27]